MKTFLKIILGFLLVLIIAVVAFLYTFDANDYKKELASVVEKATGRSINIAGNAEILLYPWLEIRFDDVSVKNPEGFSKEMFATIDKFDVKIELMPLLQKRLKIEKLVLNGLEADLEQNVNGQNNWSDFTGDSDDDESKSGLSGFTIGTIEMSDARLSWLDIKTGKRYEFTNLKLETEAVKQGQPLPVTFNAYVKSSMPEWESSVFAKTSLVLRDDSPILNANDLKLVINALLPESDLEKITVAMITQGEVNLQTHTAKLSRAKLSTLGMVMSGELTAENIFSLPVIQGPLKIKTFEAQKLADNFKVRIPVLGNAESLKSITLKTEFKTNFNSIELNKIVAAVDESSVTGFIQIKSLDPSEIKYDLDIDKLRLQDYLVADKEVTDISLPIDLIKTGSLEGIVDVESLQLEETELKTFHMVSNIKDGVLSVRPVTMLVGDSSVEASMNYSVNEIPSGDFHIKVTDVDAKDSINQWIKMITGEENIVFEGIVNADANLTATGETVNALKSSATGTIKISMDKPVVQGIDLEYMSRSVAAAYANKNNFKTRRSFITENNPKRKTEFASLTATFNISGNKLTNDDLVMPSELADITGSGSVDILRKKVDYRPVIDMHVANTVDIRDKLRDHPMEYLVQGPFERPLYSFNVDKYELLVGRQLVQEAKTRRIKREKSSGSSWTNVKSN